MKLVTGGAGFLGSHLVDALVARGDPVRVLDNLSAGRRAFLQERLDEGQVEFQRGDVFRPPDLKRALQGVDDVYHFAADPDVRQGIRDPWNNFNQGAVATFRVLDAMRASGARRFIFASSSTVYGEAKQLPTREEYGPMLPASAYGASKLAAEGLTAAFAQTYGLQAWVFRFANVVGPRLTHGALYDFAAKLKRNPKRLQILGDGSQEKSYMSTSDCVRGVLHGVRAGRDRVQAYNLGSRTTTRVRRLAEILVQELGLAGVQFQFTGGSRGWAGDVPRMRLDISRMIALGWQPQHTSDEAVRLCARWLAAQQPARARSKARIK